MRKRMLQYVAGGGFDKVDGNITILDCGWRADTRPGSDDRGSLGADVISLPQPNSTAAEFLRRVTLQQLSAFYTNCNSIPVQIVQLFALPTLHVLITSLNPRAGFRQESCQLALTTI